MTHRESFSEDWARVVGAPMLAGIAMTVADPGGDAVKESAATALAMRSGKAGEGGRKTAEGGAKARDALDDRVKGKPPADVHAALAELKPDAALVSSKVPDAAPVFKAWPIDVGAKVAEAGAEGGFRGFGGEKVSAAERATLDRLGSALG
jgi:hypothetical protein